MFLVDWFVWSWHLNVPGWLFCYEVGVLMFLVDCFVLELCVIRYVLMSFIYNLVALVMFCIHNIFFYAYTVPSNFLWVSEFAFFCTFLCNWFCVARFVFLCTIPCYWFCVSRFWSLCTVPFSILHSTSTLQEHLSSPTVCSGVRVAQSLVNFQRSVSDYPSGIFKLYCYLYRIEVVYIDISRLSTNGKNTTFSNLSREEGGALLCFGHISLQFYKWFRQ
jgi:hypothetical protein